MSRSRVNRRMVMSCPRWRDGRQVDVRRNYNNLLCRSEASMNVPAMSSCFRYLATKNREQPEPSS
jgi:hypothetical protein